MPETDEGDIGEPAGSGREHGGFVDVERLPGGTRLTSLRAELADRYEPYLGLHTEDKETIRRWGLGSIVSHWLLVAFMLVAILTGVAFWTGWYGPLDVGIWDGYQTAFSLHVWTGVLVAVLAVVLFPFYHAVVDGHDLLVSRGQIREAIVIAFAYLGLVRYIPGYKQARRAYDEDRSEWVGYHPVQTMFWYGLWVFVAALTLTGFALWKDLATDPAWWVAAFGFLDGVVAYETMLRLHLISMFLLLGTIAAHAYIAILPGNADFLRSMVFGEVEAWIVDDDSRPESAGETEVAGDGENDE